MAGTFRARQRIRRRAEFQHVYERGRKVHGRLLTMFILPNGLEVSRLGIAATRKLGNAVKRNLAKRRLREIFRQRQPEVPCDVVVVPRQAFFGAEFLDVWHEYESLLRRPSRRPRDGSRA